MVEHSLIRHGKIKVLREIPVPVPPWWQVLNGLTLHWTWASVVIGQRLTT